MEPFGRQRRLPRVEVAALDLRIRSVPGVATGRTQSFPSFFAHHHDSVYRALALTLGDAELAADATAEAMARAYERWSTVSTYDNAPGWVYRVGFNWATSRLRKWRREVSLPASERPYEDPAVGDPALHRAIAALPRGQRAVVVLRYLLDWSEAETAAALDISPGTVKSRLSRALARLAEQLEPSRAAR